jgi:hypothetical protein
MYLKYYPTLGEKLMNGIKNNFLIKKMERREGQESAIGEAAASSIARFRALPNLKIKEVKDVPGDNTNSTENNREI